MRPFYLTFALAALASLAPHAQTPRQPNIVLIVMDDLGYGDIGSYGATDVKTPNIDRLAREGVKLTDFYANHANCSPTRAALITGRYQQRYGIETPITVLPGETRHLPPSDTSLPRLLRNAGYATGLIGKWHLGTRTESGPNRHGFDEFWGFRSAAVDYYTHYSSTPSFVKLPAPVHDLYHNEDKTTSSSYLTDEISARATRFVEQHAGRPFFLTVAYNATHWPFQRPDLPEGRRGYTDSIESGTRGDYVAMLERADQGIGDILRALDRRKLAADTLVIFTSDNGGEWLSRNAPLFHRKHTLWEGGIRVPLLVRWPARLKGGRVSPQVGITMDLTATIVAAAGATPPSGYRPEGIDLAGPLQTGTVVERTLFWRVPPPAGVQAPLALRVVTHRAVRRRNMKYVEDRGHGLLFDIRADPGERHDLAQRHHDIVRDLREQLARWESDVDAEAKTRSSAPAPGGAPGSGPQAGPTEPGRTPALTHAFTLRVQVGPPVEFGEVPRGRRRIISILGGTFEGPAIRGRVLPGGADWQIVRQDGLAELDTRYVLQTDAGSLVYIQNAGIRHAPPDVTKKLLAGETVDPSQVYFKTVPTFETSAPELQWLTRAIFIGTGERHPSEVIVRVWRVE